MPVKTMLWDKIDAETLPSIAEKLNNALREHSLIVIVCRCAINYAGRSRSILPDGDRVIMVKTNGSVLVHRPFGYSPVNWQPETSFVKFEAEGGLLRMIAVRDSPREVLEANIQSIYAVMIVSGMHDEAKFTMYVSEKEVKDIIEEFPEIIEPGLKILEREKRVEDGIIDFLARDSKGRIVVIEVKDERAGIDAGKQLLRYVKALSKTGGEVRGILVAPGFSKGLIEFLERNGLEKVRYDQQRMLKLLDKVSKKQASKGPTLEEFMRRG